jgi:acyl-coenzyme A synthetase/AMP-(fatty) acid ligase
MNNWFDHILHHMRVQPETPAMVTEDRVVTYGMLRTAVERCAQRIAALDIPRDGAVAVILADPIRHMALCLALFRLGRCSVSLTHDQSGMGGLAFAAVLGDARARAAMGQAHRLIEVTDAWFAEDIPARPLPPGFAGAHQICRMSLTSGTTGEPKVLRFTVADIGRRTNLLLGSDWSRLLCLPGLSAAWGFWTGCATLVAGGTLCFSAGPFQSIRMIELFAIDYVMAATEQLLALARAARSSRAQLASLRLVEVAGGVPSRALLQSAMIYVCRDVYCRYGASETGAMARAHARDVLARAGFAGRPLPGVEIAIVDPNGKPCAAGAIGLVRCRHDPRWDGGDAPWADLGDLGWMTAEGELFVVGRAADLGTPEGSAARQISPVHEAEHLLRLDCDATDAAAVMIEDGARPQIWIGTVDCKDADAAKLEAILRSRGIDCAIRLIPLAAIPRGVSGKVNRAQLKAAMAARMPNPQDLN